MNVSKYFRKRALLYHILAVTASKSTIDDLFSDLNSTFLHIFIVLSLIIIKLTETLKNGQKMSVFQQTGRLMMHD